MFVGQRMSRPVIPVKPDMPIHDALDLFKREHIRRAPVIKDGKLVGIVTQTDLLNASPSPVTSLSIWEIHYLLAKLTVSEIMTKEVITINEKTPIEEAARIMADNKIGGLPVMSDDHVVGMITETDLFKVFLELLGARESGLRVTLSVKDQPGELLKITQAIAALGGNFISFGQFSGADAATRLITFKVSGVEPTKVREALTPLVQELIDVRLT